MFGLMWSMLYPQSVAGTALWTGCLSAPDSLQQDSAGAWSTPLQPHSHSASMTTVAPAM